MARTLSLVIRNLVFTVVVPGLGGAWVPWRIAAGPYRWVRNPIYLAALLIVLAAAWLFWSLPLLVYAAAMAVFFHLSVRPGRSRRSPEAVGPTASAIGLDQSVTYVPTSSAAGRLRWR